jgi:hypothetical protein
MLSDLGKTLQTDKKVIKVQPEAPNFLGKMIGKERRFLKRNRTQLLF